MALSPPAFPFFWAATSLAWLSGVYTQTWCGKNYKVGQPAVPPNGAFERPLELDSITVLEFRCLPRVQPYLESDDCSAVSILVDTRVTFLDVRNSSLLDVANPKDILLSIDLGDHYHNYFNVAINSSTEVLFPLCGLEARKEPYLMSCKAEVSSDIASQSFQYTTSLAYLPKPSSGSVTKLDRKTGALLTPSVGRSYEPIFPIGFYTDFWGYLAHNLTILDELKDQGFNVVHPVPSFDDTEMLNAVLDKMEALGLYLMYDMRHSYQNLSAVAEQVHAIKSRKNLLLWYTADEPDGPGDPLVATKAAYDRIYDLDGYHPVSLALNCDDHFFEDYASGADIILSDVYMVGHNATFSTKYGTPCTREFGCCGCDNCQGEIEDLPKRLDDASERLRFLGWERKKFLWSVTQAFGGEEFWSRPPTGKEWLVQALISINHGARGIIPWIDPTPDDIKQQASRIAKLLPRLSQYLFDPTTTFGYAKLDGVDMGFWKKGSETLVLAANVREGTVEIAVPIKVSLQTWLIQDGAVATSPGKFVFEPLGCAVYIAAEEFGVDHDEL